MQRQQEAAVNVFSSFLGARKHIPVSIDVPNGFIVSEVNNQLIYSKNNHHANFVLPQMAFFDSYKHQESKLFAH